jgi:hypothetical protein
MLENGEFLASDGERQQTILRLHEACGEGRLTLDEFSERVQAVFASRTRGQLSLITADLPPRSSGLMAYLPEPITFTFALLSDMKRKGRWRLEGQTTAISVLADCTLDLRHAIIQSEDVIIDAYVMLGALKIIVPPGTPVDLGGFAVLGSSSSKVEDDEPLPGVPIVRVRGFTLLGALNVVSRERNTAEADNRATQRMGRPELLES